MPTHASRTKTQAPQLLRAPYEKKHDLRFDSPGGRAREDQGANIRDVNGQCRACDPAYELAARANTRDSGSPSRMDTCRQRGFRGIAGDCGSGCYCGPSGCLVTTNAPGGGSHSNGTHSFETDVIGNEFDSKFGKNTTPASEYYISGWRYDTPGASQGIDDYFGRVNAKFADTSVQDCKFDPQESAIDHITITAPANLICEGGPHSGPAEAGSWGSLLANIFTEHGLRSSIEDRVKQCSDFVMYLFVRTR
jgi:hypothetical protein